MEPMERIIVGAQVLRHPALPSNGAVELSHIPQLVPKRLSVQEER
jgi:hypothetical protein